METKVNSFQVHHHLKAVSTVFHWLPFSQEFCSAAGSCLFTSGHLSLEIVLLKQSKQIKWAMIIAVMNARSRVQTPLKSRLFQASIHNCLSCVHYCDDHSSLDFKSAVQYMKHFIYHFKASKLFPLACAINFCQNTTCEVQRETILVQIWQCQIWKWSVK